MVRRPYPTFDDSSHPPTEAVWRALRELRAQPPGYATSSARKSTFKAALEQAQQLFAAAASVGPASRPILLFYGLSQAGRAIAACAPVRNDQYELHAHGLTNDNATGPLADVLVQNKGSGAFTQLAPMLGSRSLPQPVRLGDVWATVAELELWPLASVDRPLLRVTWERDDPQVGLAHVRASVLGMPQDLISSADPDERERATSAWLNAYPALDGYTFSDPGVLGAHGGPSSWNEQQHTVGCRLAWPLGGLTAEERRRKITPWRGRSLSQLDRTLHAGLAGSDEQLHPFLCWWAVLYTLSMQARYVPHQWTRHVDVNQSQTAVPLEHLLDVALAAVPELILATIEDVT